MSRNSALTLFAAVAISVFTMDFLIKGVALTMAGPQMWAFITVIMQDSVMLALFLGMACRMSRRPNAALNVMPSK